MPVAKELGFFFVVFDTTPDDDYSGGRTISHDFNLAPGHDVALRVGLTRMSSTSSHPPSATIGISQLGQTVFLDPQDWLMMSYQSSPHFTVSANAFWCHMSGWLILQEWVA